MEEETPGGSRILRHQASERAFEPTGGDAELVEGISAHLERVFGADDAAGVYHELVSDLVHVDVHLVPPAEGREWHTLVTSGMAERPMTVPEDGLDRFAELVLALPADWPVREAADDEGGYWPIDLLKTLARLPHEFETFFAPGHTIPNGDPPEPYAPDTELCCALVAPPLLTPEGFDELSLPDGRTIRFFGLVLLHADEMELKLRKGTDALADLLDEHGVTELVDVHRASVVPRRRGLFRR